MSNRFEVSLADIEKAISGQPRTLACESNARTGRTKTLSLDTWWVSDHIVAQFLVTFQSTHNKAHIEKPMVFDAANLIGAVEYFNNLQG